MYKGVCKPKIMMILQMESDMLVSDLGEDSSSGEILWWWCISQDQQQGKRNVLIKIWGYDSHDDEKKNEL